MSNTYHKVIALKCKELLEVSKRPIDNIFCEYKNSQNIGVHSPQKN